MPYVRQLIWDAWNVAHIARHRVMPDEVEQIARGEHIEHQAYAGRIMVVGRTAAGRLLSVVLDPLEQDVYYPVTARPASRKERQIYRREKGGESR